MITQKNLALLNTWYCYYKSLGLFLIPTRGKFPAISRWQNPDPHIEFSCRDYDIGALCGYHFEVIDIDNEQLLRSLNIESSVVKFGRSGRASFFFRSTVGQSFSGDGWDFLSIGRHTTLPPSQHPDGNLYTWKNNFFDLDSLESVPNDILELLKTNYKTKQKINTNEITREGRNNNLVKLAWKLSIENNLNQNQVVEKLLEFDKKNHNPPWFSDKSEPHQGKNPVLSATKLAISAIKKAQNKNLVLPKLIGDLDL